MPSMWDLTFFLRKNVFHESPPCLFPQLYHLPFCFLFPYLATGDAPAAERPPTLTPSAGVLFSY